MPVSSYGTISHFIRLYVVNFIYKTNQIQFSMIAFRGMRWRVDHNQSIKA
ncbi:hypothetical protein AO366_0995 [Moraxella catarrhalis]|nr:hypothetical protein AO369_1717 [Moraxella catarrhalis]OAV33720.1 hypothetical protein AO366_0995 [Moraxella catarrhalis]